MTDRPDLVPAELRKAWVDAGHTPGVDLRTLFDEQVKRHPDKVAVIDDQKSTTYAELAEMTDRIAGLLQGWGIQPGEIVALQLPNLAEACAADLAVATLGAICLPYPGPGARAAGAAARRSTGHRGAEPERPDRNRWR